MHRPATSLFFFALALTLGLTAYAQSPAPPTPPAQVAQAVQHRFDDARPRFYVQRLATREMRPKEGLHAPSEMTLDWHVIRSRVEGSALGREALRLRGLKTGTRNRHGDRVEIDSRSTAFARGEGNAKLREQVQRLLGADFEARFTPSGELRELLGAEALFEAGERREQRVEELRSMLRLATPILPSAWQGVGTRWTYEMPYLVSNWLGGHRLTLRVEAEVIAIDAEIARIREKLTLVGDVGREASGYRYREGRGEVHFDLRRGTLHSRTLLLAYGEPGFGAEYEVEITASDTDPHPTAR
jgi:hypothetical protein